jgi:hypothetical protein
VYALVLLLLLLLQETTSQVNLQFLAYSQQLTNQFLVNGVPVATVSPTDLLSLRFAQLRNININQVGGKCGFRV